MNYKRKYVEIGVFEGDVSILAKMLGEKWGRLATTVCIRKLEWLPFMRCQNIGSMFFVFVTKHACDGRNGQI